MKATLHADGSLHIVFNKAEKFELFNTLEIHTTSSEPVKVNESENLLKALRTNGKDFCRELFAKHKFSSFDIKDIEELRFKHRIIDVWSIFDTLKRRGVMSIEYNNGIKAQGNRGNKYRFLLDISNQ